MLRSWTLLLMSLVLATAGCSVHPPVALYQLDGGQPEVPTATDGALVLLGPLTLADYLQAREAPSPRRPLSELVSAGDFKL